MITSVVILVIGNNLARAFGLVGAMSIIRFRTAVRDVQDIVFIFFSLSIGMAAGVGLYSVAIGSTLLISLAIIILHLTNFGSAKKKRVFIAVHLPKPTVNRAHAGSKSSKALPEIQNCEPEKRCF